MSDFDIQEWMDEEGYVRGTRWSDFHGKPVLEYCEVEKNDGTVIAPCWPTNQFFVDLSSDDKIPFSDVKRIRYFHETEVQLDDAVEDDTDDDPSQEEIGKFIREQREPEEEDDQT